MVYIDKIIVGAIIRIEQIFRKPLFTLVLKGYF